MEPLRMKTRIQKWGNSLAVRIPKSFASEVGITEEDAVELALAKGQLMIRPIIEDQATLAQLLRRVTDENLHGEWDTGPGVGREIW